MYAVLGLVDHTSELLQADYTKSVQDAYRDAALFLVREGKVFDILSSVYNDTEEPL